jgi:putrescine transport system permease protein
MRKGLNLFNVTSLVLGFAFLYLPIVLLVIFSFNDSRLVTVWGGFSTRWYAEIWQNQQLLDAAWVTIRVAVVSATVATVLGTLAAVALTRMGRFPGRTLFSGMIYAPLAHISFTMCFVAVVVQARLVSFDRSLEEAAMDLGAPPLRTFLSVTLPIIFPAVAAGWMLAFTLSLDDLVIASFTTGPGATTLPMRIYSQVRLGVTPEINAVSTIFIAVVTLTVITATLAMKRQLISRARAA